MDEILQGERKFYELLGYQGVPQYAGDWTVTGLSVLFHQLDIINLFFLGQAGDFIHVTD